MYRVVIGGRFHGLNEFIDANRRTRGNWSAGNAMKQEDQRLIYYALPRFKASGPLFIRYHFFEPNTKRDKDNISGYFHKIFQDALVQRGIIPNDGWKYIDGFSDYFYIDKSRPRVEVELFEIGGHNDAEREDSQTLTGTRRHHKR